jgi:hypothetical protein
VLTCLPSLTLIDAEDGGQRGGRKWAGLFQEVIEVGLPAMAPLLPVDDGWVGRSRLRLDSPRWAMMRQCGGYATVIPRCFNGWSRPLTSWTSEPLSTPYAWR